MNKKILGLGVLFSTIAPVVAVISCGPTVKDGKKEVLNITLDSLKNEYNAEVSMVPQANAATIKVAVRSDEISRYEILRDKFNALNKGHVELVSVNSQGDPGKDYAQMAATGDLPDAFIASMETMLTIKNGNWARGLDINKIFAEENKATYDVNTSQQTFNIPDGSDPISLFDKDHIQLNSNANGVAFAIPQGFGAQGLTLNTTMVDDSVTTIYDYVPADRQAAMGDGVSREEVTGIVKLTGAKHEFHRNSGEDKVHFIQRYLYEAGNAANAREEVPGASPWLGYGPGNVYQRIYSIAHSMMISDAKSRGMFALSLKESLSDYSLFASAGVDILDDKGVLKGSTFDASLKNASSLSKMKKYFYDSIGGYMIPGSSLQATSIMPYSYISYQNNSSVGEHHGFHTKQSMFLYSPRWGLEYVENFWGKKYDFASAHGGAPIADGNDLAPYPLPDGTTFTANEGMSSGQIATLSTPYSTVAAADSWAISKSTSAPKALLAKRFMKWLYTSTDVVYKTVVNNKVTWSATAPEKGTLSDEAYTALLNKSKKTIAEAQAAKVSSSFAPLASKQIASGDVPVGFAKTGIKDDHNTPSDKYGNIGGKIWQKNDGDFWGVWSNKFWTTMTNWYKIDRSNDHRWTHNEFNATFDQAVSGYFNQREQE